MEQVCLTVLENDTAVGTIYLTTKDVIHRSIDVQSRILHVLYVGWFVVWQCLFSRDNQAIVIGRHHEERNVVSCCSYQVTCIVEAQLVNNAQLVLVALYILHGELACLVPAALKYYELACIILQYEVFVVWAECHSTVVATIHVTYELIIVSRELALLIEVVVASRSSVAVVTTCIAESRNEEAVVGQNRLTILVYKTSEVLALAIYFRRSTFPSLSDRAVFLTDIVNKDVTE